MTQGELETYLDAAANILRGNADHSEFRGYVFALLFYKRINDCYEEEARTQANKLIKAGVPQDQAILLARDPLNHHFIVPEAAAWGAVARTAKGQLGQALNEAMLAIERANAHRENNFDGILTGKIDFNKQDELPRDKLVNLINHFGSQTFDRAHVSDDLFGNAYEYLIRNFASKAGKSSGEFYTPAEVGFLMAEVLQPQAGMSICDWASGSGGLLLQCIRHVKKHGGDVRQLQLHGQESNVATYNISRINMILHGIPVWEHKQGDSLRDPRHLTAENRLKQFDRIIMNPPFSLEDWGYDTVAAGDKFGRLRSSARHGEQLRQQTRNPKPRAIRNSQPEGVASCITSFYPAPPVAPCPPFPSCPLPSVRPGRCVMAKPYLDGKGWAVRMRIKGQDIYLSGFATEAAAKKAAAQKRQAIDGTGKPKGLGPWRTSVGQALQNYGLERLPFLKGAKQEARRINRYLRALGLDLLKPTERAPEDGKDPDKGPHWAVELVPCPDAMVIPKGLHQHRDKQARRTREEVLNPYLYAAIKRRSEFVEVAPATFVIRKKKPGDWPLKLTGTADKR